MKKIDFLILFFILIIGLIFRLYKINIPLADFHSWRQADTASVAKNFIKNGFDLLHPKYDDLSNIQSGIENPKGYRMVEFPLYNTIFAYLYKIFPYFSLEIWGRLTSIFFSLIIISLIYYFLLKEKNRLSAFFGSFIYAVMPFFVFYSRVILPETTALAFSMISIFFLYLLINNKNKKIINILFYFVSLIFFSSSLLIKPTAIFFVFPLIYLFFKKDQFKIFKKIYFYFYFILAIIPLIIWRNYINNFPEGIPANEWLITGINTGSGLEKIFFKPAFFRWIFFERINNLILGGYLTFFLIIGIIQKNKNYFFYSFLISTLSYLFVFQGGNVQHDYYQTLILPTISLFSGLGINFIFENKKNINFSLGFFIILIMFFLSWFFSFYQIKNHYNYSQELIQQANIIKSLTLSEDKIIVDKTGDTTLLYLSERKGAPAIYKDPEELKKIGYQYLITSSINEIEKLKSKYKLIFENENFSIFKL
ncbi:MAG: glycosyltransferase family 39 protein [Patescibacteria group bacterium]|nr:glycosyltransferase family 39 protein [Patescibacteria group bacterium]